LTPDEARKLLGAYATGSLTEAERTALFQAALEDQALFDELAGEQVLKEVLEEPGARQRLLAALEPPRDRVWLWAGAAAAATVAIVVGFVVSQRTPQPPQQIAQVVKSPEPVAPPAAAPAPTPAPAPRRRNVAPAPPPAPSPEPPAELKKEEDAAVADRLQEAKPKAPAAARGAPRARNETVTVTTKIGPLEFTYAVGADGFLQIDAVQMGFISVSAEFTDRDDVIFPSTEVAARTPIRIQIPANATGLIIGFSRTPGVNNSRIGRPLVPGMGFDPDPPNGTFRIEVPAKP
jgi:hypothetical protein